MTSEELATAIQQIKAGNQHDGRQLLVDLLRRNPKNEAAWMWLASVVEEADQKRDCLERTLAINPDNENARLQLDLLQHISAHPDIHSEIEQFPSTSKPTSLPTREPVETKLITLACPSCGAALQITSDKDFFVCPSCGNSHVIRRSAGMVALEPVLAKMREMQEDVDRASAEISIHNLNDVISNLQKEKAPYKKGLMDGVRVIMVAVFILFFLSIGFYFQPFIYLAVFLLFGGLTWSSYNFVKQRQLDMEIQLKQLEIQRLMQQ